MKHFGLVLRFGAVVATLASIAVPRTVSTSAAPPTPYTASSAVKINVMGEWAHPDDDTSIIGPCGVWHQLYGIRCGIIQVTRGEGGGNAVGDETGTALGLRRENEDRAAHYRSGTVDLFYVDKVDFFYNQSAPLTQFFWGHDDTLRRITRIIRATQPDIYIGFTPTLAAGHGNHQEAGRLIWEGVLAAADPNMFPDQLTGPNALSTWQIKKVFSGGSTAGSGGSSAAANCTAGFVPAATNMDTVAGVWTGYPSPYLWPAGNLQGMAAGTAKSWAQVASEGRSAYPTQSRTMFMGTTAPGCSRFGQTESFVPFQPNINPDGTANAAAGQDNAIFDGATIPDPGGLPLGTLEYLTFSRFFNVAGGTFQATVHVRSGSNRALRAGTVALTVPSGWTVDPAQAIGPITSAHESTATFNITPSASAAVNANFKISALLSTGGMTGYTDNVVQIVAPAEGRFHRWGNWAEYDSWLQNTVPQAYRLGRSAAVQSIGIGETISVPVDVHNWSNTTQSGNVSLTLPSDITADAPSKPYGPLAPGADTQVAFNLTNTDTSLPVSQSVSIPIVTTFSTPASSSSETLSLSLVPATTMPQAPAAPTLDGQESPGEYPGPALDISRLWQGSPCSPAGVDCGTSGAVGDPTSTYAKVAWNNDNLYFFIHVRDDYQSYAVTPQQCVAHWLADSVEILIDPRGNSSQTLMDTATTFKLGIFPFTNDPTNSNGNGVNGPCWERDADNHQGYATGPLAATVAGAPNAPGVQVVSTATWVGSNETTTDHTYTGGGYNLEVKIPMADLPSAVGPTDTPPTGNAATNVVNPLHMGLNITPYDEDNTAAAGTTTLRHIDQSTRLAWSAFNSVQSDPYRWGHAYLSGYTPPAGRPTTPTPPIVGHPNLDGTNSPQTIYQSAVDGVPISGRNPAPPNDRITISNPVLGPSTAEFDIHATGPGTAHFFLWSGDHAAIPVWLTSCSPTADPAPDYGFTPCAVTDGGIPPWAPDMSGRVIRDLVVPVASAGMQHVSIPLDSAAYAKLAANGSALVSFETPNNEVQAFYIPLTPASGPSGP